MINQVWKKIKDSFLFFAVGLVVFLYGAWHVVTLIILPHVQNLTSKMSGSK